MELRHLRYFIAVAEELHFGRAARRLRLSQPPLSFAIRDLEDELGVRLFERTSRQVALTPAGGELMTRARAILQQTEAAKSDAQRAARGELGQLAIGYSTAATYGALPPLLRGYRSARPGVRLVMQELRSADQIIALRAGQLDAGFVCLPVPLDGLRAHVLERATLTVALPRGHRLAARPSVPVEELRGLPAIETRPTGEPSWANAAAAALARARVTLEVVQEADSKLAVLALVAAGMGVALLASSTARLRREGVVFRPVTGAPARFELGLVHRADDHSPLLAPLIRLAHQPPPS